MKPLLIVANLLFAGVCSAERTCFDDNWKFLLANPSGAHRVAFKDDHWRVLDLPHDWSVEGRFDRKNPSTDRSGYLPTGIGWYRKTIEVPEEWKGKQVAIGFDGVFRNSTVWANGIRLGNRPYGWISFEYDISTTVAKSNRVTFAVQVDNRLQHAARWYTGSGIYGHTWINIRQPVHIPTSGVWVRTQGSTVAIDTDVLNATQDQADCAVRTSLLNANGKQVASQTTPATVKPGQTRTLSQTFNVASPSLWSPSSPYLYLAVSEVLLGAEVQARVETRFGVRDVQWKPGEGLLLNGEHMKLRGVCQHQHCGALGGRRPREADSLSH